MMMLASAARRRRLLHVARTVREIRAWRSSEWVAQRRPEDEELYRLGLVPTMGALHEGHASILRRARAECSVVAASIFVNPSQFGAGEDLDKYPRRLESDLAMLERLGIDAAFVPSAADMYPRRAEERFVVTPPASLGRVSAEGRARPGHFEGVATVCAKLFNLVRPAVAYFGQKDAAQCAVLGRMVSDLDFDLRVQVVPTARDADGLALSSRNAYLSDEERRAAPVVYRALSAARDLIRRTQQHRGRAVPAAAVVAEVRRVLAEEPLVNSVEYVSFAAASDMAELAVLDTPPSPAPAQSPAAGGGDDHPHAEGGTTAVAVVSVALKIGNVRLIDNIPIFL